MNTICFIEFSIQNDDYASYITFHSNGEFNSYVYWIVNLRSKETEQKSFGDGVTAQNRRDDRILEIAQGHEIIFRK